MRGYPRFTVAGFAVDGEGDDVDDIRVPLLVKRRNHPSAGDVDPAMARQTKHWRPIHTRDRHPQRSRSGRRKASSAVVAAGRSSDFGLPSKRRFPFFSRTVRGQSLASFVPITAASQRRNLTGFPFNKTEVLHLHTFTLHQSTGQASGCSRRRSRTLSEGSKPGIWLTHSEPGS